MKKYKLIGLTGGTGSGKSIVREFFRKRGYKIIDADIIARKAVEDKFVLNNIALAFGNDLIRDGELNRRALAERAFKDSESVKKLNALMHPTIIRIFLKELKELADSGAEKILFDAPQLFEAKMDVICDYTVAVVAEKKLRIERIVDRDNISVSEAEKRLSVQLSDSFFKENCDFYIENNNSEKELKEQVSGIISRI